jgi:hypothetical protein
LTFPGDDELNGHVLNLLLEFVDTIVLPRDAVFLTIEAGLEFDPQSLIISVHLLPIPAYSSATCLYEIDCEANMLLAYLHAKLPSFTSMDCRLARTSLDGKE